MSHINSIQRHLQLVKAATSNKTVLNNIDSGCSQ